MKAEWTPMPFAGQRSDPNAINLLRFEFWGKGFSSRLFYNEVPQPTWLRHQGHIDNPDRTLYSFKWANQDENNFYLYDTTTKEGREQFETEFNRWRDLTPELFNGVNLVFPHEHAKELSQEPHFQRVWRHYRKFHFKVRMGCLIE